MIIIHVVNISSSAVTTDHSLIIDNTSFWQIMQVLMKFSQKWKNGVILEKLCVMLGVFCPIIDSIVSCSQN